MPDEVYEAQFPEERPEKILLNLIQTMESQRHITTNEAVRAIGALTKLTRHISAPPAPHGASPS
jgi:hypothetical protein